MSHERDYSTSDERWDDRVGDIARDGWSVEDMKLRESLGALDRRRFEQAVIDLQQGSEARIEPTRSKVDPIATPEQAQLAIVEHGSERKAARALRISKTQLRRLLGREA